MGASSVPFISFGERAKPGPGHVLYRQIVGHAMEHGKAHSGYHNTNYALPLSRPMALLLNREPGMSVTVRIRHADALPVVIRTWQNEADILRAVRAVLPNVPECLYEGNGFAIHSYVEGVPLSSVCGNGKPVDALLIGEIAKLLAQMTQVRRTTLPSLPASWPSNGQDSQGFLQTLAHAADQQIRRANLQKFGGLFAALGIPEDALTRFAERVPVMTRRPYSLLHADLHRDNLIVTYGGYPSLICVDWELATYGDPLHDLAIHLVRMQYPRHQWSEVVEAWAKAMEAIRPGAVSGVGKDLAHYVAFELAQSVYPDVIRAATSLEESFDQKGLDAATSAVRRALQAARDPLRLRLLPGEAEIERVLFRWRISRGEARKGIFSSFVTVHWKPDRRVPERPDFPRAAVQSALLAEGAAPAGRVFKGTGHLNSVVRVPGIEFPVVVRRQVQKVFRRERSFLSEHAVLTAIENSDVPVATPRILALGESYPGKYRKDRFAIHTYEGPLDIDRPPNHPVHGLLPHEADRLVDQLSALKGVDYTRLDPAAGEAGYRFYSYLSDQLVLLVQHLPQDSQQLARQLGLPDAERLRQILARHQVTDRRPILLHGDLNPWNLVRRDDAMALTIIDWEMAVVGDPLYDLVRHMHLTPTRPEIRDRMFRRWERLLPDAYTQAWQQDWRVYRWIEIVRSAYVDLDRLVTGASLDAPNVRRAVDSYAMTLAAAKASLGLPVRETANPHLARALG